MQIQLNDGTVLEVRITMTCTTIIDSYRVRSNAVKKEAIDKIRITYPEAFGKRSNRSILSEWKAHNAMYCHNIEVERTRTSDFEHEQTLFHAICFALINIFLKETKQ